MAGFTFPSAINTSTLNAWLKEIEEPVYHNNPLMGFARKRGLIKYRAGEIGKSLSWAVSYDRRPLRQIDGAVTDRSFAPALPKLHANVEWTGYDMAIQIDKLTRLINSNSATQIYKLVESTMKEAMEDFLENLGLLLWQDGTITGSGMQGYMSLHGASSTATADGVYTSLGTYTPATPADGTSPWWNCPPTRSYAGLNETLGTYVNAWTGDSDKAYPAGQFPRGYHMWTPIVADYNSDFFTPSGSSSTHSWDTQWQQVFNAVEAYQTKLCKVPIDLWILDADLLRRSKDSLIDNTRFAVTETSEARSLGFPSLNYNGWELLPGYGVPDGMAAGFTFSKMEIRSLQSQLVEKTTDSDIRTSADLTLLDNYCQVLFKSPKYFPILVPATAAGT